MKDSFSLIGFPPPAGSAVPKARSRILILLGLLFITSSAGKAQGNVSLWEYDLAAGVHSYHLPGMGARWEPAGWAAFGGVTRSINNRQTLGVTLRLGYARSVRQGDALQVQLLFNVRPLIANRVELGFSLGAGYQFSFYPSAPLRWEGQEWLPGKSSKGLFQVPLQVSLGYRSVKTSRIEWSPYIAYQLQALLGYSPDLSLLPVGNALLGLKISPVKNNQ